MSRRRKREVAPPPQAVVSSTAPFAVPTSQAAPYPYGGLGFPPPPTAWLASPQPQAMPGSSAFHPPAAGKTDIKTKFAAGLLKRQSGTRKTIARDHEEGHRRLVADYFANQPLYPERMKMFSCPIHGAELLTANDGSSGNGHMMQWFNEESIFD
uniref:Uncharacterized protein n=1 Tax=Oryza rufipogon TaxID=4529 RepID=A0A0E0QND3_ORYRU